MIPRKVLFGWVVVVCIFVADQTLAREAAPGCPSAEACLSSSLERNWRQYQFQIENAWAEKAKVESLIDRARTLGRPDIVARLQDERDRVEANWTYAEAVGITLSSDRFEAYIRGQQHNAAAETRFLKNRLARETELYRRLTNSTIGPGRAGVIQDIKSYEKELNDIAGEILDDSVGLAFSSLSAGLDAYQAEAAQVAMTKVAKAASGSKLNPVQAAKAAAVVASVQALVKSGAVANRGIGTAKGIQAARDETKTVGSRKELLELYKFAATSAATTVELIASVPAADRRAVMSFSGSFQTFIKVFSKASVWIDFAILSLDSYRLVQTVNRFENALQRQEQVETTDAYWRNRVESVGAMYQQAQVREVRANRQIEHQQHIKAVFADIQRKANP